MIHPSLSDIRLHGWLSTSARAALDGYLGQMPQLCHEVGGHVFGSGRLGLGAGGDNAENVTWWNGESEGNWLAAWLGHVALAGSAAERQAAADYVAGIVQDPDGSMSMFQPEVRAESHFLTGDLWTQTCLLRGLRSWASATDNQELHATIDRATRAAGLRFAAAFEDGSAFANVVGTGHDLMFVDVLFDAFQRRPDSDFADCARRIYESFSAGSVEWEFADFQRGRLESPDPVAGHGAHVAEHARVPLLLAAMTGSQDMRSLFDRAVSKIRPAIGLAGALKSDETVGWPGQDATHYPEAGNEYCAITEWIATCLVAAEVTGQAQWLDAAEAALLNAVPAGVLPGSGAVAYLLAENQTAATAAMGARWDYSPTHDDAAVCCAPNAGRVLPLVAPYMVVQDDQGLRVQLYGPMEATFQVEGVAVVVRQETEFPFTEDISIAVSTTMPTTFRVKLRVPHWCTDPQVSVDSATGVSIAGAGAWLIVTAQWSKNSRISLSLPQLLRVERTADSRVGIYVGPLLMALPIPHQATATRSYSVGGLADLDIIPVTDPGLPPILRQSNLDTAVVMRAQGIAEHSWAEPGVYVEVVGINPTPRAESITGAADHTFTLVPFGSTTLRWAALSMIGS